MRNMSKPYRSGSQWYFPTGNLGMGVYLTDKQMLDVVTNYQTSKPIPHSQPRDPRHLVQTFYPKDTLLRIYAEHRPKVKRKEPIKPVKVKRK